MCGIAGIIHFDPSRPVDRAVLERMTRCLAHRGPDGEGFLVSGAAGLGHRRLAIIDLEGGRQPLANEDETVWAVCNGEIYNFVELREDLLRRGHRFRTQSDTEVIVHQYEEQGTDCLQSLRGMFALALWDQKQQRLLLARDRFGKKPLWIAPRPDRLLFASEMQGLLADPSIERAIDPGALDEYLTLGYIRSPRSIFPSVSKIPPASWLTWTPREGLRQGSYWRLDYRPKLKISEAEAVERFLELFREAVRIRLRSDVPVGAFLSGGLDSGSVVAMMAQVSSQPVRTFSIGFEDSDYSELPLARQVAEKFGTRHQEFIVRPETTKILPELVRHYGEPYADSSCLPSYYVAREARQHVTVALNGDGGDELLAGYARYLGAAQADKVRWIPPILLRGATAAVRRLTGPAGDRPTRNRLQMLHRFLQSACEYPDERRRYLRWMSLFSPSELDRLYTARFRAQLPENRTWEQLLQLPGWQATDSAAERCMAVDVLTYLPEDLLVKMDIASMIHALEVRSPLLDHVLAEFLARLPIEYKLQGRVSKALLRKAMGPALPPTLLQQPKRGFGIPVGRWLRGELQDWMRDRLLSGSIARQRIFEPAAVQALIEEHRTGRVDHRFHLWALLMLELWYNETFHGA